MAKLPKQERDIITAQERVAMMEYNASRHTGEYPDNTALPVGAFTIGELHDTPGRADSHMLIDLELPDVSFAAYKAINHNGTLDASTEQITALANKAIEQHLKRWGQEDREIHASIEAIRHVPDAANPADAGMVKMALRISGPDDTEQDDIILQDAAKVAKTWLEEAHRLMALAITRADETEEARNKRLAREQDVTLDLYSVESDDPWTGKLAMRVAVEELLDGRLSPTEALARAHATMEKELDGGDYSAVNLDTRLVDADTGKPFIDSKTGLIPNDTHGKNVVVEAELQSDNARVRHGAALDLANAFSDDKELKIDVAVQAGNLPGGLYNLQLGLAEHEVGLKATQLPLLVKDDTSPEKIQETMDAVRDIVGKARGYSPDQVDIKIKRKLVDGQGEPHTLILVDVTGGPLATQNILGHLKKNGTEMSDETYRRNICRSTAEQKDLAFSKSQLMQVVDGEERPSISTNGIKNNAEKKPVITMSVGQITGKYIDADGPSSRYANIGKVRQMVMDLAKELNMSPGAFDAQKRFLGGKDLGGGVEQYGDFRVHWPEPGSDDKLKVEVALHPLSAPHQVKALNDIIGEDRKRHRLRIDQPVSSSASSPQGLTGVDANGNAATVKAESIKNTAAEKINSNIQKIAKTGDTILKNPIKSSIGIVSVPAVGLAFTALGKVTEFVGLDEFGRTAQKIGEIASHAGPMATGLAAAGLSASLALAFTSKMMNRTKFDTEFARSEPVGIGEKVKDALYVFRAKGVQDSADSRSILKYTKAMDADGNPMGEKETDELRKNLKKEEAWRKMEKGLLAVAAISAVSATVVYAPVAVVSTAAALVGTKIAKSISNAAGAKTKGFVSDFKYTDKEVKEALAQQGVGTPLQDYAKDNPIREVHKRSFRDRVKPQAESHTERLEGEDVSPDSPGRA